MKKKTAAKKSSRKIAKKPVPKKRKKRHVSGSHAKPKIHVYVADCFVVETRVHAPAQSSGGYVTFVADGDCTLDFDDGSIFGLSAPGTAGSLDLVQGNNKVNIEVEAGQFSYTIEGCEEAAESSRSEGGERLMAYTLLSDPKDIIVP